LVVRDGGSTVRVKIETGGEPFEIHSETLDENVRSPHQPVRTGIALKPPIKQATVTLTITPDT